MSTVFKCRVPPSCPSPSNYSNLPDNCPRGAETCCRIITQIVSPFNSLFASLFSVI